MKFSDRIDPIDFPISGPIFNGCHVVTTAEQKYEALKAQMLAVSYFVQYLNSFLASREILMKVGNKNYSWLDLTVTGVNKKLATKLAQCCFGIQHGSKQCNVDTLEQEIE